MDFIDVNQSIQLKINLGGGDLVRGAAGSFHETKPFRSGEAAFG